MLPARRRATVLFGIAMLGTMTLAGPVIASLVLPTAQAVVVAEDEGDGGSGGAADPGAGGGDQPAPPADQPSAEPTQEPQASDPTPENSAEADASEATGKTPSSKPSDDGDKADSSDAPDAQDDATDQDQVDPEDESAVDDTAETDAGDEGDLGTGDDPAADEGVADDSLIDEPLDEADVADAEVGSASIVFDVVEVDGIQVTVGGSGLQPSSRAELWVFSSPRLLATGTADEGGAVTLSATLPGDLGEGDHTVLLKGVDTNDQPVEIGSGVVVGPNGELLGTTPDVDVSGLTTPRLSDNPKAPPYQPVVALDEPAAVVSTAIAAFALMSVAGAGIAAASRPSSSGSGVAGGGINESLNMASLQLVDVDVSHNRGWRTRFRPVGMAPGDRSWLHRSPFTSYVDEGSFVLTASLGTKSPLIARMVGDAAPLRAIVGSASLLLPIAGIALGVASAVAGHGIAEPPALGFLIALIIIGVVDALAGGLAALAFALTVAVMGGVIDWSSLRTLMGVAMLVTGPGLVASSFREIRRAAPNSFSAWWERAADLVIVPLLGAYTTYAVATALPPLGGSLFPVAEHAAQLGWLVAGVLVIKIVIEEVAARWFPERLATVTCEAEWPGTAQQLISALMRLAIFLFVSAAFIGMPWQLWVGGLIWFLPLALAPFAVRLPNAPRLWQVLPQSMPYLGLSLLVYLVLAVALGSAFGDGATFAVMSFFILMVPDFILGILWLFGREPKDGDVRWYLRPSMVGLYRVGGVIVLGLTVMLAMRSIF